MSNHFDIKCQGIALIENFYGTAKKRLKVDKLFCNTNQNCNYRRILINIFSIKLFDLTLYLKVKEICTMQTFEAMDPWIFMLLVCNLVFQSILKQMREKMSFYGQSDKLVSLQVLSLVLFLPKIDRCKIIKKYPLKLCYRKTLKWSSTQYILWGLYVSDLLY